MCFSLDQTAAEIEIHERNGKYLEVRAVRHCVELLESRNVVVLSGREGSGKSRNGLEILRQIKGKNRDFEIFKLIGLNYVSDIVKDNVTSIVLFDDAFGQFYNDKHILDHLYSYIDIHKLKLIFTMRNSVKHACQQLTHILFHDLFDIDLNSETFQLTKVEKENMLSNYCDMHNIMISVGREDDTDQSVSNRHQRDDNEAYQSVPGQAAVILERETMNEIIETDPFLGFRNVVDYLLKIERALI
ncbi:unnamed protein product [Mytilus edulis]|uniref:Novel STAND NTPase 3 domain-containing protein n=1 Tax=Mytilus edulis TaxID=6550 RepID=A0A8S3SET5_MYTED|nr:unnamed protein product [Mytilus edulis]